jgi:hypothetical protein
MIVLGVDGSRSTSSALAIAADEAQRTGQQLRVICPWLVPLPAYGVFPFPLAGLRHSVDASASSFVKRAVAFAERLAPDITCIGKAVEGRAHDVLVAEAGSASLMVVGIALSRSGNRAIRRAAHCPVTFV